MKNLIIRSVLGTGGMVIGLGGLFVGGVMANCHQNILSKRNLLSTGTLITSTSTVIGSIGCFYYGNCWFLYSGIVTEIGLILISYQITKN